MPDHELQMNHQRPPGLVRGCYFVWILVLIASVPIALGCSASPRVQFYERTGKAGKAVRVQCDRDGDVLHLYLAAECMVASSLWISVTAKDTNTILCSTHGDPRCTLEAAIPPISNDPDRVPTNPVEVNLSVPGLARHPGEIVIEVGGDCDTGAKAVGGTVCLVKRH